MGMQRKRKLELFLEKERSTSLVRGTTAAGLGLFKKPFISIHVPRERDDSKNVAFCNKLTKAICANRSKEEL